MALAAGRCSPAARSGVLAGVLRISAAAFRLRDAFARHSGYRIVEGPFPRMFPWRADKRYARRQCQQSFQHKAKSKACEEIRAKC